MALPSGRRGARPSVRLTRSGVRTVLGATVGVVAGRLAGIPELSVLSLGALALVATTWVRLALVAPRFRAERTVVPARVPHGEATAVDLRVHNLRRLATPVTTLTDHLDGSALAEVSLAPVARRGDGVARYRFVARNRGVARLGPVHVGCTDPFGLVRTRRWEPVVSEIVVLPRLHELSALGATVGGEPEPAASTRRVLASVQEEPATLRDYQPGDDVRHVHWPATARAGRPIVRHFDEPWQRHTVVLLDTRRAAHSPESFERAVSAAASVAVAGHRRGDSVRVVRTDGADSGVIGDERHLDRLLDELAAVGLRPGGSLAGALRLVAGARGARLVSCLGGRTDDDTEALASAGARHGLHVVVSCGAEPLGTAGAVEVRFDHDGALGGAWDAAMGGTP